MLLLILGLLALAAGMALVPAVKHRPALGAAVQGFGLVSVIGLVLVDLLPHAIDEIGAWAVVLAGLGAVAPFLTETTKSTLGKMAHRPLSLFALAGLAVHGFIDGGALAVAAQSPEGVFAALGLAVIFHRLPSGLILARVFPGWWLVAAGVCLAGSTLAGFFAVETHWQDLALKAMPLQALMAGFLLHFLIGHSASPAHGVLPGRLRLAEAAGAVLGAFAVVAVLLNHPVAVHCTEELSAGRTFVVLARETAPGLLLALLGAGLIQVFVPASALRWLKVSSRLRQALRGVAFGLPLPLCSCGVLPFYATLVRRGVPQAAAVAFLISAPELGLDALLVSWPLLGPGLTLARLLAAFAVAVVVAVLVSRFMNATPATEALSASLTPEVGGAVPQRLRQAARYAFVDLPDHLLPWMVVGLGVAALLEPSLHDSGLFESYSWLQVPLGALLGMPMYVCASGATPLVAILLHKGLSPGAALAFLLTGPATNITTLAILRRQHGGWKVPLLFGGLMLAAACACGAVLDLAFPTLAFPSFDDLAVSEHGWQYVQYASLAILAIILLASFVRGGPSEWVRQLLTQPHVHEESGPQQGGHADHHHHHHGHHHH